MKNKKKLHVKFVDTPPTQTSSNSDYFKRLRETPKDDDSGSEENCMKISSIKRINEPCFVEAIIENVKTRMEVDCGSAVSVIDERDFHDYFGHLPLQRYGNKLVVVDGANLEVLGCVRVTAELNDIKEQQLELIVLKCAKRLRRIIPLLGRKWLDVFFPEWRSSFSNRKIHKVSENMVENTIEDVKRKFDHIFKKTFLDPIVGF